MKFKPDKCKLCHKVAVTDLAHMISYRLARTIIVRQTKIPVTDQDYSRLEKLINRIRDKAGDIKMCSECHKKSDTEQEKMVELLNV